MNTCVKTYCVTFRSAVTAALWGCSSAVRGIAANPTGTWASTADTYFWPAARGRRAELAIKTIGTQLSERGLLSRPVHHLKKVGLLPENIHIQMFQPQMLHAKRGDVVGLGYVIHTDALLGYWFKPKTINLLPVKRKDCAKMLQPCWKMVDIVKKIQVV